MSSNGRAGRLERLETIWQAPQRCTTCSSAWQVCIGDEPLPPPICPECGAARRVVHIVADDGGDDDDEMPGY